MFATLYSFLSFTCGIALLVVAFIHFFKFVLGHRWCHDSCVGPYLYWNDDDFLHDTNARFRQTFSLMPKPFGENFGVFFLAMVTIRTHFHWNRDYMTSFRQNAFWLVIVALFGAFPFAGGLGVVVGFVCCATAALGMILHLSRNAESATLNLHLDDSRPLGKIGSLSFPEWFFNLEDYIIIGLLSLTVLNNFIHIFKNEFHHWCKDSSDNSCIGPYLIWPEDFIRSVNTDKWGSVFSLDLNRALELWSPSFLVLAFLLIGTDWWISNALWLVLIALFGAFGYSGNLGIIVGIMLCVEAVISFLTGILGADREAQTSTGGSRYRMMV